ncbi:TetR family transcriptional regulator [Microlunatus panaciterrae]|uniref:AcrR family transcriptional regulator n=1 Tax=Microlunatus panaciterrae TaxID=400768 RepID=A0ABS2RJC6_9ACTN|nr:TetR/AcrR family transcriptional regulator [Microlunatus panaciterrae]MBM7798768.1 AcrR family transcriptional regulator [Microlunatus panaciterrae]
MPRIRADTLAAHRELMWTRLLDAFADAMAEVGYPDLTLADVAARAGMARNTIYNYVPDKEALMMAFIERSVEQFVHRMRSELADLSDARTRMEALIRRQMHQFVVEPGSGPGKGLLEGHEFGPATHLAMQVRFKPLHTLIAEIVSEGIDSGEFRAGLDPVGVTPMISALVGSERVPVGQGQHDPDEAADRVTEFVLAALS